MTLALALIVNTVLVIALLGGLAYVMTRPRRLTPHAGAGHTPRAAPRRGRARRPLAGRTPVAAWR